MSGKVRANFNIDCSVLSYAELEAFKAACQAFQEHWKYLVSKSPKINFL